MSGYVVLGTQWGDEGKGKAVDLLANKMDFVVRCQGGNNAGHTVVVNNEKFILHLLPSGVLSKNAKCLIGPGVVVDINVLCDELQQLSEKGVDTSKIYISDRAHVILPYHILIDEYMEEKRASQKIGTTKKGIGPCYMDKILRIGIRMCDLLEKDVLENKLKLNFDQKSGLYPEIFAKLNFDQILNNLKNKTLKIKTKIIDTLPILNQAVIANKSVLFEGAQATMLDIDHGTYPFVTSSNPTIGGIFTGSGVPHNFIKKVIGIAKAYTTRVGEGPFPSELDNLIGGKIREKGHEYGATTNRKRRCGWLDLVVLKYAIMINGITDLVLTKLDVLSGVKKLKIVTSYEVDGDFLDTVPASLTKLKKANPVYVEMTGWHEDISKISIFENLPENAKIYVEEIEKILGVKISMISVGAERENNILRRNLI